MKVIRIILIVMLLVGCQSKKEEVETVKRLSFLAVGDNLIHQRLLDIGKKGEEYDFSPFYNAIKKNVEAADLSFVNQETILGGEDLGYSGYPAFNTPDIMAKNLSDIGFDIVNGATNHSLDKGYQGVLHSMEVFNHYPQLTYIGLNKKEMEREIPIIEKNGIKLSFLSYTQYSNYENIEDEECLNRFDKEEIRKDVENAKEVSDVIFVSAHWGEEYDIEPNSFQREYAQLFADLGVDVVLGTHTHTLQSIEWIEGVEGNKTLVAYSLGNFISGMMEEETQLGGLLSFDIVLDKNIKEMKSVTLTPLVNHYEADVKNVYETRDHFSVYKLKDYSEDMSKLHGLNGYQGITISVDKMKQRVKERVTSGIKIEM